MPGFSLSCIFVLLPCGPWCLLRLSVQWSHTDETEAGYSATVLDLGTCTHQMWSSLIHICVTCLWAPLCSSVISNLQQDHASSSQLETDNDSGAWLNKNLAFASLFSTADVLQSIGLDVHAHHYGGTERTRRFLKTCLHIIKIVDTEKGDCYRQILLKDVEGEKNYTKQAVMYT